MNNTESQVTPFPTSKPDEIYTNPDTGVIYRSSYGIIDENSKRGSYRDSKYHPSSGFGVTNEFWYGDNGKELKGNGYELKGARYFKKDSVTGLETDIQQQDIPKNIQEILYLIKSVKFFQMFGPYLLVIFFFFLNKKFGIIVGILSGLISFCLFLGMYGCAFNYKYNNFCKILKVFYLFFGKIDFVLYYTKI